MEIMVDYRYSQIYKDKTVLVTGHTGFKGSWLCAWLEYLGANVIGYSLKAETNPNHFEHLNLKITSIIGDIQERDKLKDVFETYQPEIVFHLAAQAIVRYSYVNPVETFQTNIMGTINIFEACRSCKSVKAIVNITSDKAYQNREKENGYREDDPMGGHDPYSASKGCAELISASYRDSFFKDSGVLLASCRAGNVVGGGDWAEDRLVCDVFRAVAKGEKTQLRNPQALRPWQHVLDALSAYLLVGQRLLEGDESVATAWNFGPDDKSSICVVEVLKLIKRHWSQAQYTIKRDEKNFHETSLLRLDCSKAKNELHWQTKYDVEETFKETTLWYKSYYEKNEILTIQQLEKYIQG